MNETDKSEMGAKVRTVAMIGSGMLVLSGLGACVNINAPDKPIVINLNIAITQEVVYRLDNQAKTVIQENPGIF